MVDNYYRLQLMSKKGVHINTQQMEKLALSIQKTSNKLLTLKDKQDKLNQGAIPKIKDIMDSINKSTSNAIKKVAKWGLAVFGVRSAYMAIRNAMNVISQNDEQLKADIEYMKNIFAYVLEPVVRKIVELAKQLMFYIGYITQMLTGKNIFESADKSLKSANKNAKDLKKTMAGFDEMNVASGGGSSSGGVSPSFNLGDLTNKQDVGTLQAIISGLAGIASGLTAIHLGLSLIKGLGIGVAISGIVYSIQQLLEYLNDPTWENFGGIMQGIGVTIIGIGIGIAGLPGIIIGGIVLIYGTILKYWEDIKQMFQNGIDWLKGKSDWVRDMFGDTAGDIYDTFVGNLQEILNWFDGTFNNIKKNFDEIINFIKNVFAGKWKEAWQNIKNIFKNIWDEIKLTAKTFASTIGESMFGVFKNIVNSILNAVETILNKPINAINSLLDVINAVPGINLGKLPTFDLPRLAVGGIVNMPSRGVPIGGAIAGEAGAEGVIPLTNSQAMETLGQAIGKYVTINANITNTMNGRVISRE